MTEEDARSYRSSIKSILTQRQLDWIVEQAEEKMSLGKLTTKNIDANPDSATSTKSGSPRKAGRQMTKFLSSEPYSGVSEFLCARLGQSHPPLGERL